MRNSQAMQHKIHIMTAFQISRLTTALD